MERFGKHLTLCFVVILAVSSLLMIKSIDAQTEPKPSVPQFTIKLVDASYPMSTVNPYTGISETKQISNMSIQIEITNQQFSYPNGQIYYNVRVKPSFGEDWVEAYPLQKRASDPMNADGTFPMALYVNDNSPQSKSTITTLIFPIEQTSIYGQSGNFYNILKPYHYEFDDQQYYLFLNNVPEDGKIDFQVEAILGHNSTYWYIQHPLYPEYGGFYQPAIAYDSTSGWSSTQTITIPGPSSSATSTPSTVPDSSPAVPEFPIAASLVAVLVAVGLLLAIGKRKLSYNQVTP